MFVINRISSAYLLVVVLLFSGPAFAQTAAKPATQSAAAPAITATPVDNSGIHATLGDITDSRTTGKFFEYLKVEMKLTGDNLQTVFGVSKPVITAAVDDTGRSLVKTEQQQDPLFWSLQLNEDKKNSIDATVDLLNPLRRATSVSVLGYCDILMPSQDPAALYTVKDVLSLAGKSLLPKEFSGSGLEITVMTKALVDKMKQEKAAQPKGAAPASANPATIDQAMTQAFGQMFEALFSGFMQMGDNDLLFVIKDPRQQIAYLQVTDANGVPIKTRSRLNAQGKEDHSYNYTISFGAPLPPDAQLQIYFATPKSLVHVPLKFESIALP